MYIAIVHEKGEYDYKTKWEFETLEGLRQFMKTMQGVLIANEVCKEETKGEQQ